MRAQKQKPANRQSWRVSMPDELAEKARILAKAETRTRSNLLRYALEKYIEKKQTS